MGAAAPELPLSKGKGVLRNLVHEAPAHFCCALDKQLMMDPVQSPHGGYIFERAAIARQLQSTGSMCPFTGLPLALESCQRLPQLRREIMLWIRKSRPAEGSRPRMAA